MVGENRGGAKPVGAKLGVSKPEVTKPALAKPGLAKQGETKLGVPKPGVSNPSGIYQGGSQLYALKPEIANPGVAKQAQINPQQPKVGVFKPGAAKVVGIKAGESKFEGPKPGSRPIGVTPVAKLGGANLERTITTKPVGHLQRPARPGGATQASAVQAATAIGASFQGSVAPRAAAQRPSSQPIAPRVIVQEVSSQRPVAPKASFQGPVAPRVAVQGTTSQRPVAPRAAVQGTLFQRPVAPKAASQGPAAPRAAVQGTTLQRPVAPRASVQGTTSQGRIAPKPAVQGTAFQGPVAPRAAVQDKTSSGVAALRPAIQGTVFQGSVAPRPSIQGTTYQGPVAPRAVVQGTSPQGPVAPRATVQGTALQESIPLSAQGASAQGASAQGTLTKEASAQEASSQGASAQRASAQGASAQGASAQEASAQGASAQGASAQGASAQGASAQGATKPEGALQVATKQEGPFEGQAKPEGAKQEGVKPAVTKSGLARLGISRLDAARQSAARLIGAKFGGSKAGAAKSSASKPSEKKAEKVNSEATKVEETTPENAKPGSSKPSEVKIVGDKSPEASETGVVKQEETKPSGAKQGTSKPSGSQTGVRGRARRAFSRMAAIISKVKIVATSPPALENNPIMQFFEIGKESCTAGPGLIWRVHDAYRKSDGKECSVFVFDKRVAEKLFKPKRKESMLERIRYCIDQLEKMRNPRMLQIIHALEENNHTFAFASESVLGSLHNIMAWHESSPVLPGGQAPIMPHPISLGPPSHHSFLCAPPQPQQQPLRPPFAKEYYFIDIELRYGLLQIIEALNYLHYTARQIHRNICPQVIIVTKRGTWKLFGLEFVENMLTPDPTDPIPVAPWSIKIAKLCQPNLDYLAPEVQTSGHCNILSDMFSLGLVICAVFNGGKPLLQANNNPILYMKQIEFLDHQVNAVLPRVPAALQEAVQRLLSRDSHPRPTTQLLPLIKYFKCQSEPAIQALQFLDVITMKDPNQKTNFYRAVLIDALPYIPKKLRWQHVWPALQLEVRTAEVLAAVLQPIIWLTNEATQEEFSHYVLPTLKNLMGSPKSVQGMVSILESLHIILKKCTLDEVHKDVLPLLYSSLDDNTNQIQTASLIAIQNVSEYIEDKSLHNIVLGKVKILLEKNQSDVKIISLVLGFFEKVLTRLERIHILEFVIPTLLAMRLTDPDIINRVVKLYKKMLAEKKFALTSNVMATRMIPALAPQTVNPSLNADQFANLMEILYDMLDNIDKDFRVKLKNEGLALPSPERHRPLRHQMSNDNVTAPPFNIPNLRVEQRKTSSAEDMARKNSVSGPSNVSGSIGAFKSKFSLGTGIGQWFFGSSNSANNDGNFLRVGSAFPNRRLSDNTLMTPKIRIAPSCASSPGGTPGGPNSGLPTRRHSSIGPQERRSSAVNLSPPTGYQIRGRGGSGSSLSVPSTSHCVVSDERPARKRPSVAQPTTGGSMPNTSSSVPFLLTSSMQSIRSRRPSACLGGSQGSGILQQLSSGMVRHLPMGSHSSMQAPLGAIQNATSAGYNALHNTAMAYQLFSGRT